MCASVDVPVNVKNRRLLKLETQILMKSRHSEPGGRRKAADPQMDPRHRAKVPEACIGKLTPQHAMFRLQAIDSKGLGRYACAWHVHCTMASLAFQLPND